MSVRIPFYVLIVLVGLITCQKDYTQKSFQLSFPSQDHSAYARLQNTVSSPLNEFTFCYWVRVRRISVSAPVFSYASAAYDNELTSTILAPHTFQIYKQQQYAQTNVSVPLDQWTHLCVTWSAHKMVFKMYQNGVEASSFVKGVAQSNPVPAGGIIIIGQEQDSLGGGFNSKESLNGDVSEIHLWDHILCQEQISRLAHCSQGDLEGNIMSWRQSSFGFVGPVIMKPVTLCSDVC